VRCDTRVSQLLHVPARPALPLDYPHSLPRKRSCMLRCASLLTPLTDWLWKTLKNAIRFLSNARSMTFLTTKPVMPSLPLLPGSPTRTSALTLTLKLFVNVSCFVLLGSVHGLPIRRSVYMEDCLYVCLSLFLLGLDQLLLATRWSSPIFIWRS
jgi:hypothetical protein